MFVGYVLFHKEVRKMSVLSLTQLFWKLTDTAYTFNLIAKNLLQWILGQCFMMEIASLFFTKSLYNAFISS